MKILVFILSTVFSLNISASQFYNNSIDTLPEEENILGNDLFEKMFEMLGENGEMLQGMPDDVFEGFGNMDEIMEKLKPMMDEMPGLLGGDDMFFFEGDPSELFGQIPMDGMMNMDSLFANMDQMFPGLQDMLGNLEGGSGFGFPESFGQMEFKGNNPQALAEITREMENEGLINEGERNTIELTEEALTINKEEQSPATWKKYKEIYEKESGKPLSENFKIRFYSDRALQNEKKKTAPSKSKMKTKRF